MNIAIILSGGIGSRMGLDTPKQYVLVKREPIINYCLRTFLANKNIHAIVIVVADKWKKFVKENVKKLRSTKPIYYAQPGETRQYSIFNALIEIKEKNFSYDDIVIVHDAARPLCSDDLINRCLEGCRNADGVMPVIPIKDTTYFSEDGTHIQSLLNRNYLWAGQAPEAFIFGKYLKAHEDMPREELIKVNGSTEIAYKAGLNCKMIPGDSMNFKITSPEDLSNFKSIINKR